MPKTREELTQRRFWNNDMEAIIGIMVVLIVLGTINVFSSSFILSEAEYNSPYFFLQRHLLNLAVGTVFFIFCAVVIDYHEWRRTMPLILLVTIGALILVLIIGPPVNGARRWLPLVVVQVQPAEIAKLVSIMLAASYLSVQVKQGRGIDLLNLQTGLIGVMFFLTEKEPDMGTACVILGVPLLMAVVCGLRRDKIYLLSAAVVVGVVGMIFLQPYRLERVKVTWDPWSDAQNVGYQTVQSLSAIGSGEVFGMGLGVGVSKYDYLPEAHTDFAFAIFCQENGFIGALFVFLLYAALIIYAARVSRRAVDEYGQILAMGILLLISGQAIANLLMVGGAFPVVGVPLPFISYGGTSLMVSMGAMGILINIGVKGDRARREQELKELEELEEAEEKEERERLPEYHPPKFRLLREEYR
ncbi:MAG: cell division protein FtsW [Selenomonadaceae bacterium]|nr:cell division protein FtsW [Selenomonadaceae bacterium]